MRAIPTNVIRLTVLLAATVFAPRRSPAQVPVSLGVRVTFPAGVPTVSWTAQRGATEYTVERWMESNPSCCRVRSDRLGSPSWADAGLAQAGTYVYRVFVKFGDGGYGYNDLRYAFAGAAAGNASAAAGGAAGSAAAGGAAGAAGSGSVAGAVSGSGAGSAAGGKAIGGAVSGGGAAAGGPAGAAAAGSTAAGGSAGAGAARNAPGGTAGATAVSGAKGGVSGAAGAAAGGAAGAGASAASPGAGTVAGSGGAGAAAGAVSAGAAGSAAGAAAAGATTYLPNPSGFTAVQTGPGQVRLSWQAVKGAAEYLLMGPGLPRGGVRVAGTTYEVGKVAVGQNRWLVGTVSGAGAMTGSATFSAADLSVRGGP